VYIWTLIAFELQLTGDRLWVVTFYFSFLKSRPFPDLNGDPQELRKLNRLTDMLLNAVPTTVLGIRRMYLTSGGHSLRALLDRVIVKDSNSRQIGATDPRDRVYALLGIANDAAAKDVVADYTLSCDQAYVMTARALLRHGHDDILSLCRTRGTCKGLPSWVPDWSANLRKPWSVWHTDERLFNASGISDDSAEPSMTPHTEDTFNLHLHLTAYFVDTIKELGHSFRLGIDDQINWHELRPYFDNISQFLGQSSVYTAAQKEEAEWRIPVGDTEITETNSQMLRAPGRSHMKAGHAVAKAICGLKVMSMDEMKENIPALVCFQCQLSRMYDSRPFISENGYVGLCPAEAQPGDAIVILRGPRVPYIVRKANGGLQWTLVGESHVYGIMDGEFMATNPVAEDIVLS
jgi:hypothetical protein